jgi:hypothetical protein
MRSGTAAQHHFFVGLASLEGTARRRAEGSRDGDSGDAGGNAARPAMGGMVQHMQLDAAVRKVRFGMWNDVLAEPAPPAICRT